MTPAKEKAILNKLFLKLDSANIEKKIPFSICYVGSHSKGYDTNYSDIDLILIHNQESNECFMNIKLEIINNIYNCSVRVISLRESIADIRILIYFSTFIFIFGDITLIYAVKKTYQAFLSKSSFSDIFNIYAEDKSRHKLRNNFRSPHFYNIKRGYFGIVDVDFLKICNDWCEIHHLPKSLTRMSIFLMMQGQFVHKIKKYLYGIDKNPSQSLLSLKKSYHIAFFYIIILRLYVLRIYSNKLFNKILAYDKNIYKTT